MKVISIDVGIKNMAYCIFDISAGVIIRDWKVVSLMDAVEDATYNCVCPLKKRTTVCHPLQSVKFHFLRVLNIQTLSSKFFFDI